MLAWLLAEQPAELRAIAIEPERLGVGQVSATFHGRDVFAPAAARLARGASLAALGSPVTELVQLPWPQTSRGAGAVRGEIIHVDRFGNLITNVRGRELAALGGGLRVRLAQGEAWPLLRCYADAARGAALALIGSADLLEIAVRDGNAATQLHAKVGDAVSVEL